MPQKDYVKASRPKAKPKARPAASRSNARRSAAPAPRRPWLLFIATFLLLACFVYFLWFLNNQPTEQPATPTPPRTVTETKKDELPARPTEEPYQYIKELENREVRVEVTEQQQRGPFQMQCGSFRQEQQAESMKAQIAFAGFPSTVRRTEGENGVWFRVVLGPYESRRQATSDRNRLRQQGINTCQIWNWT